MTTKKDIIIKKLLEYETEIKKIVNRSIIQSLEDIDVLDLLLYINLYFNNEQDEKKTQEQFNKALPITLDLIEWLLKFQKDN